jgi:hypothetical protein
LSGNVIHKFNNAELLPLDVLDGSENKMDNKPSWRDVATQSKKSSDVGRKLNVHVDGNPPAMDPPASAFATPSTLKQ